MIAKHNNEVVVQESNKTAWMLGRGPDEIKENIYFDKSDFDKLMKKELAAPL